MRAALLGSYLESCLFERSTSSVSQSVSQSVVLFLPILPFFSDSFRPCQAVLTRDQKGNKAVGTSLGVAAGTNFDGRLENLTVLL